MRPKKRILCVNSNEVELSILACTLEVNGYRAIKALSFEEAVDAFAATPVELVLTRLQLSGSSGIKLVSALKAMDVLVPMVVLCNEKQKGAFLHHADAVLADTISSWELLERIRIMSARKRGPRKGSHRVPFPAPVESVSLPCPVPAAAGPAA